MQKKYALALWWWSARWLAHIWVIKYLEEQNIEISEIAGTSMGAIIWAMFAIGKTSNEIYDFAKSINYFILIDFDLKRGLIKGKKIKEKLKEVFWEKKIEEVDIPLKIIATNLETGEKIVFTTGKIIDALRASISLPTTFVPYKIWKNYFIDGGFVNNLPIEVLEEKNVIAVSAIKRFSGPIKERKRNILWFDVPLNFFEINYQILQRSIIFMMEQNEEKSLKTEWKNVLFVKPDFWNLDFFDFHKTKEFVELGYESIKEKSQGKKDFFE